jgi:LCP family protein required for cell wall assembly
VILLVGVVILTFAVDGRAALSRLLDSRLLVALLIADLALLGWRLVAIVQAHADRSRFSVRHWPTWTTVALVVATMAMHAVPAYYAAKALDTIDSVALEGSGTDFQRGRGEEFSIPEPSDHPEIGERVTVLLVGLDFTAGADEHLTDTMLVATLDPETGETAMVSVPRDLYGVPLGDGRTYEAKLNSLMSRANADRQTFPLGGAGTLKAAIGELLGTEIHYFAAIDIEGMRQLIDTLGGVDVLVERAIDDPSFNDTLTGQRGFSIEPGLQHLDGQRGMAYIRTRMGAGDSDFTRAARQQQVLTAIAEKLSAQNLLVALPDLLDTVRDNVRTDIPSRRIPEVAAAAQDADLGEMERVVLTPPEYVTVDPSSPAGYILHPNLEAIRELGTRLFGGPSIGSTGP